MKVSYALLALSAVLAAGAGLAPQSSSAEGAGVYTAAQASAGRALFAAECASCHGAKLEGNYAPPLAGPGFLSQWNGQTADDVREMIQTNMPASNPGSLKPEQVVTLVAFILQQNGFPAGDAPLTAAAMKTVEIVKQR